MNHTKGFLMMTRRKTGIGGRLLVLGLLMASGCSVIPKAQKDPTRFFVLSAPKADASAQAAENAPTLRLRPIEVASYVRTRPMIVRHGDNELEFRDFARWGEPLEQGIARVLREELLARGAGAVALSNARESGGIADYELSVRVLACEGESDGGVNFRAVWKLTPVETKAGAEVEAESSASGDYRATGLRWNGRDEATLAARLSDAIGGLAAEIAGAMKPVERFSAGTAR